MFRSTVWALCLIWMTNAIGAHAGIYHELIYCCETKEAIFTNRVLNCISILIFIMSYIPLSLTLILVFFKITSYLSHFSVRKGGKRAKTHPCDINNGGCDQLCIRGGNKAKCDCLAEVGTVHFICTSVNVYLAGLKCSSGSHN